MSSTSDLQGLLRILTSKHMTILAAMGQAKSLQAAGLRSIQEIAEAPLVVICEAIGNEKTAKSVQSACRKHHQKLPFGDKNKRPSEDGTSMPTGKRPKLGAVANLDHGEVQSPAEAERSLALSIVTQEEQLKSTKFFTNRAPVLLAFTLELLRATMPEQPLSSRLSLAQAVMSSNAKAKAVDLGLDRGPTAEVGTWGLKQPNVRIMGRDITVLKRGGYPLEDVAELNVGTSSTVQSQVPPGPSAELRPGMMKTQPGDQNENDKPGPTAFGPGQNSKNESSIWSTSQHMNSRGSSFVAQATPFTASGQAKAVVGSLLNSQPILKTASHNLWGYRVQRPGLTGISEGSTDDGETGGGEFILRLLREAESVNRLVVVSRWFGGVMLGPERWRLIRNCVNEALAEGLHQQSQTDHHEKVALWALDSSSSDPVYDRNSIPAQPGVDKGIIGFKIHRPDVARSYLLRSFTAPSGRTESSDAASESPKRKATQSRTAPTTCREFEDNLARVLGSFRLLFDSWSGYLTPRQLDQKAWAWYVAIRPDVEPGPRGWGAKGWLDLDSVLALRCAGN